MRLKRKRSYEVREPWPVATLVRRFRTKAKARRYAKANGYKYFWVVNHAKRRLGLKYGWEFRGWRIEKPSVTEIQGLLQETIALHAKDLSEQYIKARNQLVLATLMHLDDESLKSLFGKKE